MEYFLEATYNIKALAAELITKNVFYYFINDGDTPIGYLMYHSNTNSNAIYANKNAVELQRIYVDGAYQSKGVGQQLLNFFITQVTQQKFSVAFLGVWEHNLRAQEFYKRNGFVVTNGTHSFNIGNTPQTDCWMERVL
jgi:diamine N-acetyltransferase